MDSMRNRTTYTLKHAHAHQCAIEIASLIARKKKTKHKRKVIKRRKNNNNNNKRVASHGARKVFRGKKNFAFLLID